MSNSYITLGFGSKSKNYPEGRLTASLVIDSRYKKGKSVALSTTEPEVAYDIIDLWAQTTSEEINVEYRKSSLQKLMSKINVGEIISPSIDQQVGLLTLTPLGKLMRNKRYFRSAIKPVYDGIGLDRIKELFADAIVMLEEYQIEKNAEDALKADASKTVAATLFEIYTSKGLDMSASINDELTLSYFRELKAEHESK